MVLEGFSRGWLAGWLAAGWLSGWLAWAYPLENQSKTIDFEGLGLDHGGDHTRGHPNPEHARG